LRAKRSAYAVALPLLAGPDTAGWYSTVIAEVWPWSGRVAGLAPHLSQSADRAQLQAPRRPHHPSHL